MMLFDHNMFVYDEQLRYGTSNVLNGSKGAIAVVGTGALLPTLVADQTKEVMACFLTVSSVLIRVATLEFLWRTGSNISTDQHGRCSFHRVEKRCTSVY